MLGRKTKEEVFMEAMELAKEDLQKHKEFGSCLNPFSTAGAKNDWQRGFDNLGPWRTEESVDFDTFYQRGRAAAILMAEEE